MILHAQPLPQLNALLRAPTLQVRHGDVLHMFGDCQQRWQHSVVREKPGGGRASGGGGDGSSGDAAGSGSSSSNRGSSGSRGAHGGVDVGVGRMTSGARISLVFKRSLANERRLHPTESPDPPDAHPAATAASNSLSTVATAASEPTTIAAPTASATDATDAIATDESATIDATVATADAAADTAYAVVLRLLRQAADSGRWPPTSAARARVLRGCGLGGVLGGAMLTFANPATLGGGSKAGAEGGRGRGKGKGRGGRGSGGRGGKGSRGPRSNQLFPDLAAALFALEAAVDPRAVDPHAAPSAAPGAAPGGGAALVPSTLCCVGVNAECMPHALPPTADVDAAPAWVVRLLRWSP